MPATSLTIRLSPKTSEKLARAALAQHRPAEDIVEDALTAHLPKIPDSGAPSPDAAAARLERLLSYVGAGVGPDGGRSMADIDAQVREFRGDD